MARGSGGVTFLEFMMIQSRFESVPLRYASVEDDGDAFQVFLVVSGEQVGCALFPYRDGGEDEALRNACRVRDGWAAGGASV